MFNLQLNAVTTRGWAAQYQAANNVTLVVDWDNPDKDLYAIALEYDDGNLRFLIDDNDDLRTFDSAALLNFLHKYTDQESILLPLVESDTKY